MGRSSTTMLGTSLTGPQSLYREQLFRTASPRPARRFCCQNDHIRYIRKSNFHATSKDGSKRQRVALAFSSTTQEQAGQEESGQTFTEMYARETPLVSVLLEEIDQEGLVYADTSADTPGSDELAEEKRQVIRTVVERHYNDMSHGLLMVLAGYAQAAYGQRQRYVAETLEMIREEALKMSLDNLPPEMQILDELITMIDEPKQDRINLIKLVSQQSAPENGLPASLGSLRMTATQMLEDMESHDVVIDRRLVARLCLIREEVDEAAEDLHQNNATSEYFDMMTTSFRLLPMGNAAYIKEVLGVPSAEKRRALVEMCFKDNFNSEKDSQLMKKWRQQGVRPGRLMNTLKALLVALEEKGIPQDSPERARLLDIRRMALESLSKLKD